MTVKVEEIKTVEIVCAPLPKGVGKSKVVFRATKGKNIIAQAYDYHIYSNAWTSEEYCTELAFKKEELTALLERLILDKPKVLNIVDGDGKIVNDLKTYLKEKHDIVEPLDYIETESLSDSEEYFLSGEKIKTAKNAKNKYDLHVCEGVIRQYPDYSFSFYQSDLEELVKVLDKEF